MGCLYCVVSALVWGYAILKVVSLVINTLLSRGTKPAPLTEQGTWAIVTGATDGIGKAIAIELAKKGLSLILISRSEEKLSATKEEIAALPGYGGRIRTLEIDFADTKIYPSIKAAIQNMKIAILVNNVGMSYSCAERFEEINDTLIDSLIDVNVRSVLRLSHMVYQNMVERKMGTILCVGSGSSQIPSDPLYSAYAGTKSCAEAFCRSLQVEAKEHGIVVQCHIPLFVSTKMSKVKQSMYAPSAQTYAIAALEAVSSPKMSTSTIIPYFFHRIIMGIISVVPPLAWHKFRLGQTRALRQKKLEKEKKRG
eukprot:GHVN01063590.1.p1 GENE.GHVN01063590.1~~GHVN01063590.1.p1  ORF type:complete len:310 (+),score=28.37 GHVN01063590.1:67-996(+)